MNVVTEVGEGDGNAIDVVGQAAVEVGFGNKFRCGEGDAQVS